MPAKRNPCLVFCVGAILQAQNMVEEPAVSRRTVASIQNAFEKLLLLWLTVRGGFVE